MKRIIGFAGRKRSGKGALCEHLRDTKGATIVTVANALKQLCCELIRVDSIEELNKLKDDPNMGLNLFKENTVPWTVVIGKSLGFIPEECKTYEDYDLFVKNGYDPKLNELATIVSSYLNKKESTVRELLQFVGTDIIRHFNPNWHVEKLIEAINNAPTDLVVVDDVRFPNERKAIDDLGGYNFFVVRPDLSIDVSNHSSETSLTWTNYDDDRIIVNMYDLQTMFNAFDYYYNCDFVMGAYVPSFKHGACQFNGVNDYFGYRATCTTQEEAMIKRYVLPNLDKTGAFVIHSHDEQLSRKLAKMIYTRYVNIEGPTHTFVIWNPFVVENLKAWL